MLEVADLSVVDATALYRAVVDQDATPPDEVRAILQRCLGIGAYSATQLR